MASQSQPDHDDGADANLARLLSSLASGVRAVHSLPLDDDFLYESTYPEFAALVQEGNAELMQVLSLAVQQDLDGDDPTVWETCADACDWLLEQAELYLRGDAQSLLELSHWSHTARDRAQSAYARIHDQIVQMEKPQVTYGITVDNTRTTPFVPVGHEAAALLAGRANDTRYGGTPEVVFLGDGMLGPTHHFPHLKRDEILHLKCTYPVPSTKPEEIQVDDMSQSNHLWVDTVEKLSDLVRKLESVTQIAVDLEAHSYRSFAGLVCLMQITLADNNGGIQDYLIDTLALWHDIPSALAPTFANPNILKIMHGADSDVPWLQRDFGIYVVNLLDTGRAARLLKLSSFSLAHLCKTYLGITVDKTHQLSDWRQRPLPEAMEFYAKMDTHYLIDIAQHLLWDVQQHSSPEVTIETLFQASQQVCLIRYDKEVFRTQGYKSIILGKRKSKTELSEKQDKLLRSLYDWRDVVARDCDESPHYVCSNKALLRLAMACPTSVTALQSLLNPMPPLVLRFAHAILDRTHETLKDTSAAAGGSHSSSAFFFKPAEPEEESTMPRGLLSPVLGTEALYKEAGWMTPSLHDAIHTSTEDDTDDAEGKPKNLLLVDDANKEYRTAGHSSHSLATSSFREKTASGLGAASCLSDKVEAAAERAQRSAANVRKTMGETNLLGLISHTTDVEEEEDDEREEAEDDKENDDSETEFEVPRSMREIYKVSNRNRRNKNIPSLEESIGLEMSHGKKMDVDTLEGAETVLSERGRAYFDGSSKRPKHDEDDLEQQVSQEDDIAFMQQIGWVKDAEEAETLKPRPRGDSEDFDGDEDKNEKDVVRPFDYSTVGNIGVYDPTAPPAANPFFAGAAVAGSGFNQGSAGIKREKTKRGGKSSRPGRGTKQEKPEKKEGKSFVYKKK
jgi:exosome complex exonuclease RRP6